jgi:hypothetical protein
MTSFLSGLGPQQPRDEAGRPYESPVREAMTAIRLAFDRHLDTGLRFNHAAPRYTLFRCQSRNRFAIPLVRG